MASMATKRLSKELLALQEKGCTAGVTLLSAPDLVTWYFTIEVLGESVFKVCRQPGNTYTHVADCLKPDESCTLSLQGEIFALRFTFSPRYPIESPEVVFVVDDRFQCVILPRAVVVFLELMMMTRLS